MIMVVARNWWALVLRGTLAVIFGILAFALPGITLGALVLLFGAYALVDGVLALAAVLVGRRQDVPWWALLLEGITGIGAGLITFFWPGITAIALLFLIAAWAVVTGILEIVAAVQLRKEIRGEWLLALGGVLSVVFGILLVLNPAAGALAVVWLIAIYAITFGALMIALGFRLRSWAHQLFGRATSPPSGPGRASTGSMNPAR